MALNYVELKERFKQKQKEIKREDTARIIAKALNKKRLKKQ